MTCPHCDGSAGFHSHREHTVVSLVGAVRYRRAYYLCRACGKGLFPFDRGAGMTARDLTPALERVATLAGAVADSFEKGAELLEEMAGVRASEATVERTAEDAGRRLAGAVAVSFNGPTPAGQTAALPGAVGGRGRAPAPRRGARSRACGRGVGRVPRRAPGRRSGRGSG